MKPTQRIILTHLLTWIILSVIYFFSAEILTKKLFPGYDNVELWLLVTATGLILIFAAVAISFTKKIFSKNGKMLHPKNSH